MKNYSNVLAVLVASAFVLALVGCNTEKEPCQDRSILKAGQQVGPEMVGWVAVPNSSPKLVQDKDKKINYAVLSTHQVVPSTMNGWEAMPADLFTKMTDIKVEPVKETAVPEKWVLKPEGKAVPKDKNGWVAVPFSEPKVEARHKGLEMANIYANNIVPKDMNGWVAIDTDTLAKVVEPYLTKKGAGAELPKDRK